MQGTHEINPCPMRQCIGCQGQVPDVTGPVHPYMKVSPGCWQWYGELTSVSLALALPPEVRLLHVDCFAVQHPTGAEHDRRQRQSVAVHLTALCLFHEYGITAKQVHRYRSRTSQTVLQRLGLTDWPHLRHPPSLGAVTVADLYRGWHAGEAEPAMSWLKEAWQAWSLHHPTVRSWAQILLEGAK
ncbi:DUF5946 family protein [Streptomyces sp. NPDC093595]|uniref:DUF5946 family protein n=1 Tax=Streptomyces sp. NPDC093595 TaxID=3366045 RepID=UPI00382EF2EA